MEYLLNKSEGAPGGSPVSLYSGIQLTGPAVIGYIQVRCALWRFILLGRKFSVLETVGRKIPPSHLSSCQAKWQVLQDWEALTGNIHPKSVWHQPESTTTSLPLSSTIKGCLCCRWCFQGPLLA